MVRGSLGLVVSNLFTKKLKGYLRKKHALVISRTESFKR